MNPAEQQRPPCRPQVTRLLVLLLLTCLAPGARSASSDEAKVKDPDQPGRRGHIVIYRAGHLRSFPIVGNHCSLMKNVTFCTFYQVNLNGVGFFNRDRLFFLARMAGSNCLNCPAEPQTRNAQLWLSIYIVPSMTCKIFRRESSVGLLNFSSCVIIEQ